MDGWMFLVIFFLMNKKIHPFTLFSMDAWVDVFRDFFFFCCLHLLQARGHYFGTPIFFFFLFFILSCSVFFQVMGKFYICFTSCCHNLEASCGSRIFHFLGRFWAPSSVKVAAICLSSSFKRYLQTCLLEPTIVETKKSCCCSSSLSTLPMTSVRP
jgi:hypothetical protein